MKTIILVLVAMLYGADCYGQALNGTPNQSVTGIPNSSLNNSSVTLTGSCGVTNPGSISLGSSATIQISLPVNAQTGTTYTIASTDCGKLVTFNNASSVAVTMPTAGGSYPAGWAFVTQNYGAGTVTLTPSSGTINGGSANLTLSQGQGAWIFSDGTNWQVMLGKSTGSSSGTVNAGTAGQMAYYASSSTTISGNPNATISNGILTLGQSGTAGAVIFNGASSGTATISVSSTGGTLNLGSTNATVTSTGLVTALALINNVNSVSFSATPTFALASGDQTITLTGNVTGSSVSGLATGQLVRFRICQDATGSRTFVWPTAIHGGGTIGPTASTCNSQAFESFDGSTLTAIGPMVINQ
jgi:hypothetical protein